MMLDWHFKYYNDLSRDEFHDIIALRVKVFVVEQNCPYQEVDGKDKASYHLICKDKHNNIVGTMRILPPGVAYKDVSFGRIALEKEVRGKKEGHKMIEEAMKFCKTTFGQVPIILSGQKHLEKFYNNHGFLSTGKEYLEDDIPHVEMSYNPYN